MNSNTRTRSLADALFGKAKQAALGVLFSKPGRALHLREIARLGRVSATAMQRELDTLLAVGILIEERRGNQRLLRPNPDCPLFPELKGLAAKTFGVANRIKAALKPVSGIEVAFIFGSVAKGEENAASDVDLVVVGTCSYHEVLAALGAVEEEIGRPINPMVYAPEEFRRKRQRNPFVRKLLADSKIFLAGNADGIES